MAQVPPDAAPGFDMFVEKCADGTETLEELSRRWNALSEARKNTWSRLSRLRSTMKVAPEPQPQPQRSQPQPSTPEPVAARLANQSRYDSGVKAETAPAPARHAPVKAETRGTPVSNGTGSTSYRRPTKTTSYTEQPYAAPASARADYKGGGVARAAAAAGYETPQRAAPEAHSRPHSAQFPVQRPANPEFATAPTPRREAKQLAVTDPSSTLIVLDW